MRIEKDKSGFTSLAVCFIFAFIFFTIPQTNEKYLGPQEILQGKIICYLGEGVSYGEYLYLYRVQYNYNGQTQNDTLYCSQEKDIGSTVEIIYNINYKFISEKQTNFEKNKRSYTFGICAIVLGLSIFISKNRRYD